MREFVSYVADAFMVRPMDSGFRRNDGVEAFQVRNSYLSQPLLLKLVTVVVAAVVLVAPFPVGLYAQSSGTVAVSGALVNGTPGGSVPAGVAVLLHRFGAASGSVDTFETVTDDGGAFRFDDVPVPENGDSLALAADYGETRYTEVVSPAKLSEPLTLTVYEFTRDVGVVTTAEQSVIVAGIDAPTRRMAVVQLFTLENRSDTTLAPDLSAPPMIGQFSFLRFSLPANATDLDVSTDLVGGEVIPVGTGFAITAPVQPGRHQVSFTFTVPYEGDEVTWRDNTLQGAETFNLLIPEEFGNIGVGGLAPDEGFTVGAVSYRAWRVDNLAAGEGVNLTLSGLPEPSWLTRLGNPLSDARFWYGAIPVLVAVALAGLLAWGIWRRPMGSVG